MQQTSKVERPQQPHIVDYSAARAKAIAWLGDRYLLAKPINRKTPPPSVPLSTPGTLGLQPAGQSSRRSFNHLRVVGGSCESSNDSVASGAGRVGRLAVDGAG